MNEFLSSVNTILPLLFLVALGAFLKKINLVPESFYGAAEKLVFKLALPCSLFMNIYNADAKTTFNPKLILFCVAGVFITFLIPSLTVPLFIKDNPSRGAFIQGVYRSNFAIIGVPLAKLRFGDIGEATVSSVIAFSVPLFNIFAVTILSIFAPAEKKLSFGEIVKKSVKGIVTNPLIIGIVLALPFMLTSLTLPTPVVSTVKYCGNMVTPLALICLGASMGKGTAHSKLKPALVASMLKVAVLPAFMVVLGILAGFRNVELGTILILFGGPTAVSSYIMAKNMDSDHELAGEILLISTVLCALTLFAAFYLLAALGLIV